MKITDTNGSKINIDENDLIMYNGKQFRVITQTAKEKSQVLLDENETKKNIHRKLLIKGRDVIIHQKKVGTIYRINTNLVNQISKLEEEGLVKSTY